MNISKREKECLLAYLQNPRLFFLDEAIRDDGLDLSNLPDGTKITRGQLEPHYGRMMRSMMIPVELGGADVCSRDSNESLQFHTDAQPGVRMVLLEGFPDDVMQHSCTIVSGRPIFHDHISQKKMTILSSFSADDFSTLRTIHEIQVLLDWYQVTPENYRTVCFRSYDVLTIQQSIPVQYQHLFDKIGQQLLRDSLFHDERRYYKYETKARYVDDPNEASPQAVFVKRVIKSAEDAAGRRYCLLSNTASSFEHLPLQNDLVRQKVDYYLSEESMFRVSKNKVKQIDVIPYFGETLANYLERMPARLWSEEEKNQWSQAILRAYCTQIEAHGLVHTDLSPSNICIEELSSHQLRIIDMNESFVFGLQSSSGIGTPGYLAPEFFNHPVDCEFQLDIRARGELAFIGALKPNFRELFSPETDRWALGRLLLNELLLTEHCRDYALAKQMCDVDPLNRSSITAFLADVDSTEHYDVSRFT